jgi:hypothetical protein
MVPNPDTLKKTKFGLNNPVEKIMISYTNYMENGSINSKHMQGQY